MKKLLALLLALVMVLSFAACGGEEEEPKKDRNKKTTDKVTEPDVQIEGEEIELDLFTLVYDSEIWEEDEDYKDDTNESWSKTVVTVPDGDSYKTSVSIWASVEDLSGFRENLHSYGFEAEKYVDGDYDTVDIGGIEFLEYETEYWGEACTCYFARAEAAGASIHIEILGDYDDAVDSLLKGLKFTLKDKGNEDIWPWQGKPFEADDATATVGEFTVESAWIPFDESFVTFETFDNSVAVVDDTVYILSAGKLYAYDFTEKLELDEEYAVNENHDTIYADESGFVWISGFMADFMALQDGKEVYNFGDEFDTIAMAPNGQWGVNWFSGPECTLVTVNGDAISTKDITFEEVDTIMHLNVDNDFIYVCGSDTNSDHKVFVYDKNGNLQMTLAGEDGDGMGSITFMAQVDGGFMGLDGNMRTVVFWDEAGNWVGELEDSDLFGTYYPWFCSAAILEDGSILVIMTEDRADESAMELVAFKITVS